MTDQNDSNSIAMKKVEAGESVIDLVRLRLDTGRVEHGEDGDVEVREGTPSAVSVYVGGREYTVTDNPGGTPVPAEVVDALEERANALGFKVDNMGAADTSTDLPGEVKGKKK